jgi:hypothetical protein
MSPPAISIDRTSNYGNHQKKLSEGLLKVFSDDFHSSKFDRLTRLARNAGIGLKFTEDLIIINHAPRIV